MRRRDLIAMLGGTAVAWPLSAVAQRASALPLVAVLWPGKREVEVAFDAAMRRGLNDGGFVEGTNFTSAMRYADGEFERLSPLAVELAALKPSLVITAFDGAVLAVHKADPTVPIVVASMSGDPVALGLAKNYARPGGVVTGMTVNAGGGEEALTGKRMSLLKELVPGLKQLGLIVLADTSTAVQIGAQAAASRVGIEVIPLPVHSLDDVAVVFLSGLRAGVDGFYIDGPPLLFSNRAKVAELASQAGKPTIGQFPEQARAGLLMSYSPDLADIWHRAGGYAARILAGANAGDLPIEQPSKFAFVLNLKTAKALGLTIPPTLLARADEVIE